MKQKLSTRVFIICSVVAVISLLVTTSIQSKISKISNERYQQTAKKLGIKCIAEFVHNEEVQNQVLALGIDFSQGYFFSTALSPDEIK